MEEIVFKIIIVGDPKVGKSCILMNFTDEKFLDNLPVTVGVELGNKTILRENHQIKLQMWDTSGQEKFRSVVRSFYRRADCALLVFDLNDKETFDNCRF